MVSKDAYRRRKNRLRSKKKFDPAKALHSLSLICKEQGDHINTRRHGRSAYALLKKTLPSLRFAEEELEKPRLTLMRGDFERPKVDAKIPFKVFEKIGYTSGQETALTVPDLIPRELGPLES